MTWPSGVSRERAGVRSDLSRLYARGWGRQRGGWCLHCSNGWGCWRRWVGPSLFALPLLRHPLPLFLLCCCRCFPIPPTAPLLFFFVCRGSLGDVALLRVHFVRLGCRFHRQSFVVVVVVV